VEEEDDGRPGRKKWEAAVADLSRRRVEGEERSRGGYKSSRRVVWCGVDASSEPICKALKMSCVAASAFKEAAGG